MQGYAALPGYEALVEAHRRVQEPAVPDSTLRVVSLRA
ncbi:unnamed protein product [Ectocarpus sp. 13 AM-2016]